MGRGSPDDVKVRRVAANDRDAWLRMRTALWPEGAGDHAGEVDAHLAEPPANEAVFVAEARGGGLAGFLEAALRDRVDGCASSPVAYVEGWWVEPDARGKGVGRALVAAAEAWGRSLGLVEIASDAELVNEGSQRAHRAIGFDEVGRVVQYRKSLRADRGDD